MSRTELSYMLQFARAYPIFPHAEKLSWSEYRDLLVVNSPVDRDALTKRAVKENWSRDRLREEVKTVTRKAKSIPVLPEAEALLLAYVYRILDGDTLEAVVDLGFGFTTTQVLRLRAIDAPELATHDGMSAKEALEKMLTHSSRVLIRGVKSEKYDRYLEDVYGIDPQGKVAYLNNLLLEGEFTVRIYE